MAVLEAVASKKTNFASGLFLGNQQLVAYDLPAATRYLHLAPYDLVGMATRSQRRYKFPAMVSGGPFVLVDEGLGFPVSLLTALQTVAMYQRMNWNEPVTRRYMAGEFFRQYTEILLKDAIGLLVERELGLNLAAGNLVVEVLRGAPTGLKVRKLSGVVGPAFPQPGQGSDFAPVPTTLACYQQFITNLLEHNLRPVVAKLVELCQVKPDVLWDYAIEALLAVLDSLEIDEAARQALLVEELNPGDRLLQPACFSPSQLLAGGTIYLKRRCCEKFKQKERCSNCPGHARR